MKFFFKPKRSQLRQTSLLVSGQPLAKLDLSLVLIAILAAMSFAQDIKTPQDALEVEIISPKTADTDRGLKKQIYQDIFRTPDYFWFDPQTLEFKGFQLVSGQYQELQPNPQGWLWSQQLQLYLGIHSSKLRLFTIEGQLVPTPEQAAQQAQSKV